MTVQGRQYHTSPCNNGSSGQKTGAVVQHHVETVASSSSVGTTDATGFDAFGRIPTVIGPTAGGAGLKHRESGLWSGRLDLGQPRANVNMLDIQAQAVLLEEQSKQDHEESAKLTGQYLRQLCDTKSVRVTHACEHCRQRKAKCSGLQPCTRCTKQNRLCTFSKVERRKKIVGSLHDMLPQHYTNAGPDLHTFVTRMPLNTRAQPMAASNFVMRNQQRRAEVNAPYSYKRDERSASSLQPYGTSFEPHTHPYNLYAPARVDDMHEHQHAYAHTSPHNTYSSAVPAPPSPSSLTSNIAASTPAPSPPSHNRTAAFPDYEDTWKKSSTPSHSRTGLSNPTATTTHGANVGHSNPLYAPVTALKRSSLNQVWATNNITNPAQLLPHKEIGGNNDTSW